MLHSYQNLYAPLLLPSEIKRRDLFAHEEFGIPPLLLMENASREAYKILQKEYHLTPQTQILLFAGGGNNGGDGFALARHLHNEGCQVLLCHTRGLQELTGAAKEHAHMAKLLGVNFLPLLTPDTLLELPLEWRFPDIIIDALCGVGLNNTLRSKEHALVQAINIHRKHALIFSLDIPSGLCAYTGNPQPEAVQAHITVTFDAAKPGLYLSAGKKHTGKLYICDIGIPPQLNIQEPPSWRCLSPTPGKWASPSPTLHKGLAGKVLIVGGSEQYVGAPYLSALGAFRAGAGTVHLACPQKVGDHILQHLPETILHPTAPAAAWTDESAQEILTLIKQLAPSSIVIGPGIGKSIAAKQVVHNLLLAENRPPVLIDADALSFFYLPISQRTDIPNATISTQLLRACDVLTPHPREFAHLLPASFFAEAAVRLHTKNVDSVNIIQLDRPSALQMFTRHSLATLVLKGAYTLIGQQASSTVLSPFAVPTLSVAGSGDVLSGVIGTFLAQQIPTLDAAALGVYLHRRAGSILHETSPKGYLASEIANTLPSVWSELCSV